ncbi:MAG: hypothetical protein ACYTEQ_29765, partial [Planctomycetota bacterium]
TTAYYVQCEGDTTPNQPALPANSAWLMMIDINTSAINSVTDLRTRNPFMGTFPNTLGGNNALQNIEQYLGAGSKAFIYSGCAPTVPAGPTSLTILQWPRSPARRSFEKAAPPNDSSL